MKVGFVDLKSTFVQFHVENTGNHGTAGKKFEFKSKDNFVNSGNGFDWANQWFLAPYTGTYFFSLSGTKILWGTQSNPRASILVYLNGKRIGEGLSSLGTNCGAFSYQFSRKLNAGDKIELFLHSESTQVYLLYFTGWMLEQNLLI